MNPIDQRIQKDKKTWESMDSQFIKHDPSRPVNTRQNGRMVDTLSMEALKPDSKVLGLNEFGRPTGMFVYGSDRTTEKEFEVDLDLQEITLPNGKQEIHAVGMQLLCPKCGSPLYIRGKDLPGGHEIIVHWNQLTRSNIDGKYRPLVTVEGTFGCDYSDAEITGIRGSRNANVIMRCNWKGGVYRGRCFDHQPASIIGASG